jgi:polysaccharide biosynthesis protein PslH
MRLLVVSFIFPYPINSGGARDIYSRLEAMFKAGYEIDLIATVRNLPSELELDKVRPIVKSIRIVERHRRISDLLSIKPFHIKTRGDLKDIQLDGEYLAVIIESDFGGDILENPTLRARHRVLRVHNDESYLARCLAESTGTLKERLSLSAESLKFRFYSPALIRKCEVLWFISSTEMKRFGESSESGNGSPQQKYLVPTIYNPERFQRRSLEGASVLYIGAISVPINYDGLMWYLEHIHPQMLENPGYRFVLAGMRGTGNIDGLLEMIAKSERVIYQPDVNDLQVLYAQAAAFVNPVQRGAGVKIKTLDAVVEGMPVVTTQVGAEGTGFEDRKHAVIVDSAEEFGAGLREIITDKSYAQQLVENAQTLLRRENQADTMLESLRSLHPGSNEEPKQIDGRIGIVTVTYNSGSVLAEFLNSLEAQSFKKFRLWAIDNASTDDSVAQLRAWSDPRLEIVANKGNVGVAAANNQGITAALAYGCDYVLLLNNDVYFGAEFLDGLLQGLTAHSCSMAVPLIYYANPENMIWSAGGRFRENFAYLSFHLGFKEIDIGQFNKPRRIAFAPSSCILAKRNVFDTIGLMDERLFVGGEDTDFMYRAMRAGLKTYYLPTVKMWHKVSSLRGGDDSAFSQRYMARNRAFLIKKHLGWWKAIQYTVLYRAYYVIRWLARKDNWDTMIRKERAWSEGLQIR